MAIIESIYNKAAIERLEKGYRDYFRYEKRKKPKKKERKGQYSTFHN